jgi:hypothetical protein
MWMLSTCLISRSIKLKNKEDVPTGLMEESIVCCTILIRVWMDCCVFAFLYLYTGGFFFFLAAYMSSPCHIELILSEKEEAVQKEVLRCYYTF